MRSLLILRLSALGDVIHTMPAIVALANSLRPQTRLSWVVEAPFAELVEAVAPLDGVFRVATRRWRRSPFTRSTRTEVRRLHRDLRAFARNEVTIDFQGLVKSAVLGFSSGARRRIGFARPALREAAASIFYNERVQVDPNLHVVEQNLILARAAGAVAARPPVADYSHFALDREHLLDEIVRTQPVVLLPGAGKPAKQWNIARFALLADRLRKLLGTTPIVAWGPGEKSLAEEIAKQGTAVIAPPTDLRQLAFLMRGARLVVGADTGPLHLADALGTPVIGLYGPTNPRRTGPYHQLARCVETWSSSGRMEDISVDMVFAKTREVLS